MQQLEQFPQLCCPPVCKFRSQHIIDPAYETALPKQRSGHGNGGVGGVIQSGQDFRCGDGFIVPIETFCAGKRPGPGIPPPGSSFARKVIVVSRAAAMLIEFQWSQQLKMCVV